jgi:hypothetical protein
MEVSTYNCDIAELPTSGNDAAFSYLVLNTVYFHLDGSSCVVDPWDNSEVERLALSTGSIDKKFKSGGISKDHGKNAFNYAKAGKGTKAERD